MRAHPPWFDERFHDRFRTFGDICLDKSGRCTDKEDRGGGSKMGFSVNVGNLRNGGRFGNGNGLKSTREKLERQQECANKVAFFENQKENLKEMKCGTPEEIARKLEMLHSYEDQIASAKMAYNQEQMWHVMDEARERAEKMAEAAEKAKAKTPEEKAEAERKAEAGGGVLDDMLDEMSEAAETAGAEVLEEQTEQLQEAMTEEGVEDGSAGGVKTEQAELTDAEQAEHTDAKQAVLLQAEQAERAAEEKVAARRRFDTYA